MPDESQNPATETSTTTTGGTATGGTAANATTGGGAAPEMLRQFVERIERLEEEKTQLMADIREVYAEAKGAGFDPKIMRQVIKLRGMDSASRGEQDATLEMYRAALGID